MAVTVVSWRRARVGEADALLTAARRLLRARIVYDRSFNRIRLLQRLTIHAR